MKLPIPFCKVESVGNDFPLINSEDLDVRMALDQLAIAMCDRRFGVGGDGLLTLSRQSDDILALRMFNPDGTEDFCGNGIRCAARYARNEGWVRDRFTIVHLGRKIAVHVDGELISTEIGSAFYAPELVPLSPGSPELFQAPIYLSDNEIILGSALTTGSTHTIIPVTLLPLEADILRLGPLIEHFRLFPERTSVIWRETIARDYVKIRIWERGVGETLGCGTGSSAAAIDYLRSEGRGGSVRVDNPGGSVTVSADDWSSPITIRGTAREVYRGIFGFILAPASHPPVE